MNLAEAILYTRLHKQLKREEIKGISSQRLEDIEEGKKPTLEELEVIAKGLNLSIPILVLLSLTEEDINQDKIEAFKVLAEPLEQFILEYLDFKN